MSALWTQQESLPTPTIRFCKFFQYSSGELIGQTYKVINSKYHSTEFWQYLWKTIEKGEFGREKFALAPKDGQEYWTNTTIIPSLDENNQPIQYLEILEDISERKKTEVALEYQLQKTKLLNHITQAIRRSLDTQQIFQSATEQIRRFLAVDRVGVFQLETDFDQGEVLDRSLGKFVIQDRDVIEQENSFLSDSLTRMPV